MYRRQNTQANRIANGRNAGNEVRKEQEAEEALINIGNEAANGMNIPLNLGSNEANNANGALDEALAHYAENDLNKMTLGDIPSEIVKDGLENYYENDLNRKITKKPKSNAGKKLNLINESDERGMGEKEQPDEIKADDSMDLIGPLLKEEPEKLIDNEIGSGKKKAKSSAKKGSAAQNINEDLTQIDQSLEPTQGWDFVAQKLPARKKQGFMKKAASWLAYYTGKTIGKVGGFFATIGKGLYDLIKKKPGTFRGIYNGMRGSDRFSPKENQGAIPGWDGAKFENEEGPEDQVNADFRRVPEIWSWPIAEKAAEGDDKDKNAKPRDPVISVYISQSSKDYTVTGAGGTGHSGIGIEYSRYSALSGRWQRYNLRFGYYMAGGGGSTMSKFAVTSYNNATIPGRVMNEQGKKYNISRSFQAKPKQVTNVLRAAESYAERGGYNAYTRNCTTFAKDMLVNTAQIKGAEAAFAKDEVYLQSGADRKMFGAAAMAPITKADMENGFEKMREKDDLGYQNFGNKMASREDYEQYKNSMSLWSSRTSEADSPNAVAENLRRTEGGKSGMIGSFGNVKNGDNSLEEASLDVVIKNLPILFSDLKNAMSIITPIDKLYGENSNEDLKKLMKDLTGDEIGDRITALIPDYENEAAMNKNSKQSNLVKARSEMTDTIKNLNILLFKYYRNDNRIQKKVLPIISLLNHGINAVDQAYVTTDAKDETAEDKDLGDLGKSFSGKKYNFTVGGISVEMTPSKYEAWLQIFKTPQKALSEYNKMMVLRQKRSAGRLNDGEKKELDKLYRINDLSLDFERSHRYMITKDEYNQQDVDYALSLEKKERQVGVSSDMFEQDWNDPTMAKMKNPNASAANTYQLMIMKSVFGGMQERFTENFQGKYNMKEMLDWLNADAANCVKTHEKEMTTIIRGLKHTTDQADKGKLQAGFSQMLTKWVFQVFHGNKDVNQYRMMVKTMTSPVGVVMKEVDKIITDVLKEK